MRRVPARRLLQHAFDTEDFDLAAMIIVTGSLDYLQLHQALKPMPLEERAKELTTLVLNSAPARQ